ncbi:acetylcholinesterase-like isoform X3, partial [Vespula maculifrons]
VSWIKRKAVQELLTVGLTTYANDERFQATHFHHSEDWTLQIKYVQGRDAGLYECQVSTHPPTSIFLNLEVVGIIIFIEDYYEKVKEEEEEEEEEKKILPQIKTQCYTFVKETRENDILRSLRRGKHKREKNSKKEK